MLLALAGLLSSKPTVERLAWLPLWIQTVPPAPMAWLALSSSCSLGEGGLGVWSGVGFGTSRDLQLLQGPHLPQLGRHLQAKTQKQSPQHCSPISLRRGRDGLGSKQSFFKRSEISGQGRGSGGEKRAFFELTVRLEVVLVLPWVVPLSLLHLLLLLAQAACSWPHRLGDHWLHRNF